MHVYCVSGAQGVQKRAAYFPELGIQMVVSYHVDAEKECGHPVLPQILRYKMTSLFSINC